MAKREFYKQMILDFLLHKGVDTFWANIALKHIMLNFAGNEYWLTEIRNLKVIIGPFGMINKFTTICTINTVNGETKGRLTYTHGSTHKVRIAAVK